MSVTAGGPAEVGKKQAVMGIPAVASPSSATGRAAALVGTALGITVMGHARGSRLSVFHGEERLHLTGGQQLLTRSKPAYG